MHTLIIDHVSNVGGAEVSLEMLVRHMPTERCRFTVAVPGPGPFTTHLRSKGVAVTEIGLESWRWWVRGPIQRAKFFPTLPLQAVSLRRWMKALDRLRPDLVHLNVSRIVEPLLAAHLLGIPAVVHFREIPSRLRHRFVPGARSFYRLMNLADAWIANSTATADDISGHCGRRLFVIPNGIDLTTFDIAAASDEPSRAYLLPRRHHVAMVAGINPWKRQEDFIEVAARVLRERRDTAFYVVGAPVNRAYAEDLRRQVGAAGISDSVRFLGHVDSIPALMGHFDVLVHTTPHEPFGRVFLEAMAARRPIVACANGGASEVIVDGVTGVLVRDGAIDDAAAAVARLLDDPVRRATLGAAGRERVQREYPIHRHCEAVAAVYDAMTDAGSRMAGAA